MLELPTQFDPNGAEAENICMWMQAGLDGYFKRKMGRWAFRPLEHYVDVRYDLAEDLSAIYHDLEPHAQGRWRIATRDLLAMHGRDISRREAVRVLIDFAALIRAHEVLDVLPALVSSDPEPGPGSLLDQIVRVAVALSNQTDHARTCLERLRTSPSFSPDYAGLVLVALCHTDPDGWLRHVENLARPMDVLASRLEDESTALCSFARRILEAISLSRLDCSSLNHLERSPKSAWLWREWLGKPDSLLRYEAESGSNPRLSLRADSAQSIRLGEPLETLADSDVPEQKTTVREDAPRVLFDAYLMVDWSARQKRATGSDSIWFALLEHTSPSQTSLKAVLRNPATRSEARECLGEALVDLKRRGKRVLVGFDFPFGYPQGTALALGLQSRRRAWLNLWREFDGLVHDEPDNSNNRFSVADQLNQRVPTDGPFWGKPNGNEYDLLEHIRRKRPPYSDDLPEKRLCEKRVPRAQPVWKLHGAGSVGGQTLTGLPVLQALRSDERLQGDSRIWPFETGLTNPGEVSIVFAEIYPSLLAHGFTPLIKDASQVLATALHFAALDEERTLAKAFEGDPELTRQERKYIEREEGWILGITGKEPKQLCPLLPPMTLEHDPASSSASLRTPALKTVDVEQRASEQRKQPEAEGRIP